MNKFWTFIAGAFSGILLTIVVLLIIGSAKGESSIPGLTTFEERGQMMEAEQYSIIQTLSDSYALAMEISLDRFNDLDISSLPSMLTPVYLLVTKPRIFMMVLKLKSRTTSVSIKWELINTKPNRRIGKLSQLLCCLSRSNCDLSS